MIARDTQIEWKWWICIEFFVKAAWCGPNFTFDIVNYLLRSWWHVYTSFRYIFDTNQWHLTFNQTKLCQSSVKLIWLLTLIWIGNFAIKDMKNQKLINSFYPFRMWLMVTHWLLFLTEIARQANVLLRKLTWKEDMLP